jgi:hypothetical protein
MVWAGQNGGDEAVVSATMNADGSWTFPAQIATDTYFYTVQVGLDSQGDATAAWTGYDGTNYLLGAAERPAAGAWHADGNLATGGQSDGPSPSSGFGFAVNAAGKAALVWAFGVNHPEAIAAAVRPAGGVWSAPTTLATTTLPGNMLHPQVAVAANGTVTADWGLNEGARRRARCRRSRSRRAGRGARPPRSHRRSLTIMAASPSWILPATSMSSPRCSAAPLSRCGR